MKTTLIVYDGRHGAAARYAEILALIVSNAKVYPVDSAPTDTARFSGAIFLFSLYGPDTAARTKAYLAAVCAQRAFEKVALVGVGLSDAHEFPAVAAHLAALLGQAAVTTGFLPGELRLARLCADERTQLERFAEKTGRPVQDGGQFDPAAAVRLAQTLSDFFRARDRVMPAQALREAAEKILKTHNTLALATGAADAVRCTPLEYFYWDGALYVITEGGKKFCGLVQNDRVSAAIFEPYTGMDALCSLQITGRAACLPPEQADYAAIMMRRGLTPETLAALPCRMNLVRIVPETYELLCADFAAQGYDVKQTLAISGN
ncbi:MAG: pyridoxamine 5'-phosphate oxidase family protein [Oscillospiraceae bacterium]|nr:pyridoxamine 5'-phosphate oxidase family protein [Oscillospiraceae bacterium]